MLRFVQLALDKGYDYYLMEAFDQPWKSDNEGAVGAYWGMFRADGTPKFGLTGVLRSFPEWRFYAMLGATDRAVAAGPAGQPHAGSARSRRLPLGQPGIRLHGRLHGRSRF